VGVDRVVLIQHSAHGYDNSYVVDCARRHPSVFSVVAVVDTDSAPDDVERHMLRLAALGARGFRIRPAPGPVDRWLDGEGMRRMFDVAARTGLAVCPLLNPDALPALARRCTERPEAPVVIDHMARIGINEPVREEHVSLLTAMARLPGVLVKVSAFYVFGERRPPYLDAVPVVGRLLEAFGPRRLMWGSDCPYQVAAHRYEDSLALVRDRLTSLGADDRAWILEKTAGAVFFPDP
jgi:predicted TIM-barrel fold metal-dependent hydrolase